MFLLLGLILFISFFIILEWEEIGLSLIIVMPVIKDLFNLPENKIPVLNLLFIYTIFTIISFILKYSSKNKQKLVLDFKFLSVFIIFSSYLLFSLIYTNSYSYGLEKVAKFIFFAGFFFLSSMIIFQDDKKLNRFIKSLQYIILMISVVNIVFLIKYILDGTLIQNIVVRFTLTGNSPISMARVLGVGTLLWVINLVDRINEREYSGIFFSLLSLIPILISLIATNTRGPLIFTLLISITYILIRLDVKLKTKIQTLVSILLIGLLIVLLLPQNILVRYTYFFHRGTLQTNTSLWSASSSAMRVIFAKRIFSYLHNNPFSIIMGNGAGSFAKLCVDYRFAQYPHNIFLEILFEQGLVGLLIFLITIIMFFYTFINWYHENPTNMKLMMPLIVLLIYYFFNAQISGDLDNNRLIWLFYGASLGLMINSNYKSVEIDGK